MKIILTESQIKSLRESLLKESDVDVFTYVTKKDNKLTGYVGQFQNPTDYINVPAGTKFTFERKSGSIQAWKGALRYICNKGFENRTGERYSSTYLMSALETNFCSNGKIKQELKDAADTYWRTLNDEGRLSAEQDMNCLNRLKPLYNNAFTWWKNKLNEPAFYSKLKRLNNYTDQQTKEWISKYKNYMDNHISGPFCPSQKSSEYKKLFNRTEPKGALPDAIAFLTGPLYGSRVVVNSYYFTDEKSMEGTLVHEIQHALYDLKPMTPDANWKKVFPYKVWSSYGETPQSSSVSDSEKSTISKYGLKQDLINWWKERLKKQTDPKSTSMDAGYVCNITELTSRLVKMKKLLNYSTSQKITVNDFKKFIEDREEPYNNDDAYWIVLCWVNNGLPDIQTFLDNLDKYVVAKVEPEKDDDMKDQVS